MTTDSLSAAQALRWMERAATVFAENKDRLTQLDSDIGDGDHGANMARGFQAVQTKLAGSTEGDVGALFKTAAMTLISTVGGASGPLYGTFFLQIGLLTKGKSEVTAAELAAGFDAGLKGITNLGKAVVGDKTMIDVLTPACAAFHPQSGESFASALRRSIIAARQGAESTVPLVARKGRASYLGERSAGHLDPGSASSVLLLEALATVIGVEV